MEGVLLSDCPRCGLRELRGERSVHILDTAAGPVLAATCRRCGAELAAGSNRLLRPPQGDAAGARAAKPARAT